MPKSRWWLTHLRHSPFIWYWGQLSFLCWGCSLWTTHLSVLKLLRTHWDQIGSWLMSFCNLWTSDGLSIVCQIFTSSADINAPHEGPFKQSFMYIKKRAGPCGTPHVTYINLKYPSPALTLSVRLVRKLCFNLWSLTEIPSWSKFCSNLRWGNQSKVFLKSKYITSTPGFLFKARLHCSEEL